MRLLATLFLLLASAIYLHLEGVHADATNIFMYSNGASSNVEAYVRLLQDLRSRLASGTKVHGIAVTSPPTNVSLQERFVQVQLQNSGGEVITAIIDTVNVNVVGYLVGPALNYLDDIPTEALLEAFPSTQYTPSPLGFAGNYDSLPSRASQQLGHGALNVAISNLYSGQSQPGAVLVIIQMVSEAVRIKHIEHLIRRNMLWNNLNFIPDPKAISLENKWSDLSEQIQWSGTSGVFLRTINVQSVSNQDVEISSVAGVMRQAALALVLYRCNVPNSIIRMAVPVAVGAEEQCPSGEPTTNIVGRRRNCMEVKDNRYNNGEPILLMVCGYAQRYQLWTFKSDGTIRSNGKCLTANGLSSGSYLMIYDCYRASTDAKKWILYNNGTIKNPRSGLVITAEADTQGTTLKLTVDNNSSSQAWSAGNYSYPPISYIIGFSEMCLQANGVKANARVWLANCVIGTQPSRQQWSLYQDSTIRLYSNQSLCVTSDGYERLAIIKLLDCQGSANQRWMFMADGSILNPYAGMVMDVTKNDVSLQEIILYPHSGDANQKWLAF